MSVLNFKKLAIALAITPFLLLGSAFADDADITNKVKSNISNNTTVAKSGVTVDTKDGVVSVSGTVNNENEASIIVREAYSAPDVQDVDTTNLMVKGEDVSTNPYKDAYTTAKIEGSFVREKLFGDKPINVFGIKVKTIDGVVTLTGTADTDEQINTATSLAKKVKGVKDVQSSVQVKPAT